MTEDLSRRQLHEIAQQLAEVFAAATRLVKDVEQEIRSREAQTRRVAQVLAKADSSAPRRVMAARRAAGAAELRAAHALADELRFQAGSRALGAIHRYSGTLVSAAEELNSRRRAELDVLGHSVGQVDQAGALALLRAVQAAEERRTQNARDQAEAISAQIQAVLGGLPKPALDSVSEPRPRRRRRRARGSSSAPISEGNDVVHLDPNRRRHAN